MLENEEARSNDVKEPGNANNEFTARLQEGANEASKITRKKIEEAARSSSRLYFAAFQRSAELTADKIHEGVNRGLKEISELLYASINETLVHSVRTQNVEINKTGRFIETYLNEAMTQAATAFTQVETECFHKVFKQTASVQQKGMQEEVTKAVLMQNQAIQDGILNVVTHLTNHINDKERNHIKGNTKASKRETGDTKCTKEVKNVNTVAENTTNKSNAPKHHIIRTSDTPVEQVMITDNAVEEMKNMTTLVESVTNDTDVAKHVSDGNELPKDIKSDSRMTKYIKDFYKAASHKTCSINEKDNGSATQQEKNESDNSKHIINTCSVVKHKVSDVEKAEGKLNNCSHGALDHLMVNDCSMTTQMIDEFAVAKRMMNDINRAKQSKDTKKKNIVIKKIKPKSIIAKHHNMIPDGRAEDSTQIQDNETMAKETTSDRKIVKRIMDSASIVDSKKMLNYASMAQKFMEDLNKTRLMIEKSSLDKDVTENSSVTRQIMDAGSGNTITKQISENNGRTFGKKTSKKSTRLSQSTQLSVSTADAQVPYPK